jgi:hypothetical protein
MLLLICKGTLHLPAQSQPHRLTELSDLMLVDIHNFDPSIAYNTINE